MPAEPAAVCRQIESDLEANRDWLLGACPQLTGAGWVRRGDGGYALEVATAAPLDPGTRAAVRARFPGPGHAYEVVFEERPPAAAYTG